MSFDRVGVDHPSCDPDASNFNYMHLYVCTRLIARCVPSIKNLSTYLITHGELLLQRTTTIPKQRDKPLFRDVKRRSVETSLMIGKST